MKKNKNKKVFILEKLIDLLLELKLPKELQK